MLDLSACSELLLSLEVFAGRYCICLDFGNRSRVFYHLEDKN